MAIKLIAVDLDGTLLSSSNTILPETQECSGSLLKME